MPLDNRGMEVPKDLVLLPAASDVSPDDFSVVIDADWWEINGVLCASAEQIGYLSEDDPLDAGVDVDHAQEILYVAAALHRGSPDDGFYHA